MAASARDTDPGSFGILEAHLSRVAAGDQVAFRDLYDAMSLKIYGLIRRILVDRSQAEEVTQEVFLEIWQTAARYRHDRGHPATWMLMMARRRAIDRVRASQSSRERDHRIGSRDTDREFDSVVELVEVRDNTAELRRAMTGLTALQRQAVELVYLQEFSYLETSALLRVPIGTVKTRVRDGIVRLRNNFSIHELLSTRGT